MNGSRPLAIILNFTGKTNEIPIEKYIEFNTDSLAHKIIVLSASMSGSRLDCLSPHYAPLLVVPLPAALLSWD